MTSLKEENEKLKAEIEKLQQEKKKLQEKINWSKSSTQRHMFPAIPTIYLDTIKYYDGKTRPWMTINKNKVYFESPNDKIAQLAKVICCEENLLKLADSPVPIDEIYAWYNYLEDWFDISHEERKQFQKNLYQWARRLNDKWAPHFGNNKLFKATSTKFGFGAHIRIVKKSPK